MKKTYAIILFFLCHLAYSQQVTEKKFFLNVDTTPFLRIAVLDKETETPMEGAAVFLSFKADTVKAVTNSYGLCTFAPHPFSKADSLVIDISFLGYKNLTHKFAMKPVLSLEARLEEDPQRINAIVVKGDNIAMIRHGDTTIYNASAFTTMEGAKLADLLKKLPGIRFTENGLSAYGEKVSKVLINGTMLFESNIAAAMEMVRTEDVKKVRVYDEFAQDRLVERDTLVRKERVVDVKTKKPFSKAQELVLLALGGLYIDNNAASGGNIGGAEENWRSFEKDKTSFIVNAGAGRNYKTSGNNNSVADSPRDELYAQLTASRIRRHKRNMWHNILFNAQKQELFSSVLDVYSPSPSFSEKRHNEQTNSKKASWKLMYLGKESFNIRKNSSIGISLRLSYNRNRGGFSQNIISSLDGKDFILNSRNNSSGQQYGVGINLDFSHFFKKDGRKFEAGIRYGLDYNKGGDDKFSEKKTKDYTQHLIAGLDKNKNDFRFEASYDEPLLGKDLSLNLKYTLSGDFSVDNKLSFDNIMMKTDVINTWAYTHRDIINEAAAGLKWRALERGLDVSADMRYLRSGRLRDERFPDNYSHTGIYEQVSPLFSLRYSRNSVNLNVSYMETMLTPSLEQTRGVIDNSSILNLRAGNPSLTASRMRRASVFLSFLSLKTAGNFDFGLDFSNISQAIVRQTINFNKDTYLNDYGYTALSGSSLTIPVNKDGHLDFSSKIGWNTYSNAVKTYFSANLDYKFIQNPFMTQDILQYRNNHNIDLHFVCTSSFSKYFETALSVSAGIGRELVDSRVFYDSFSLFMLLNAKGNFLKHFWIESGFSAFLLKTTMAGLGYNNMTWDLGLTYKFGKKMRSEIIFACNDILNSSLNTLTLVTDNYVRTTRNTLLGRGLTLSYKYTFR